MMKTLNILLCGLGGQGILFMTKVLANTAVAKGLKTLGAETHGMAQRGGSVVSHLRIGDVESSLVKSGSADYLLSLDEIESYRNLPSIANGAGMFVNAPPGFPQEKVKEFLDKKDTAYHAVNATKIAQDLVAPLSSNLALLGFFSSYCDEPMDYESVKQTIESISPDSFKEQNLAVFEAGYQKGIEEKAE